MAASGTRAIDELVRAGVRHTVREYADRVRLAGGTVAAISRVP
jgi:hypothetical protein